MLGNTSLRGRLAIGLILVAVIPGLVAAIVGIHFIDEGIIQQAQNKVRLDLNTAREIYEGHVREIQTLLEFSAIRPSIWQSLKEENIPLLSQTMLGIYGQSGADLLGITDTQLRVVFRCTNPSVSGDSVGMLTAVAKAWETGAVTGGTQVIPREVLLNEGTELASQALIRIVPTPKAKPEGNNESTDGMALIAAAPVFDDAGKPIGVIYSARLLNRDYAIVDRIKDTVYRGEQYHGTDVGTSTIFLGDVRIATNVLTEDRSRAIGTRVSADVYRRVLVEGNRWTDRAFVVNGWYITAYEPLRDILGNVVGMLYVGILEKPYTDMRRRIGLTFLGIAGAGIALAGGISYLLSRSVLGPVKHLAEGARRLACGELEYRVQVESSDEIGSLCESFNRMAESLLDRDRQLMENTQRQLTQSEKLASVGRLAAGVAHEINNPLTGVLTFGHLLLDEPELSEGVKRDIQVIVDETTRCREIIRNLLDFARETEPECRPVDINDLIRKTLDIVRNQSMFQDIAIHERLAAGLPAIPTDPNQIKQVLMNLILNAAEAMPGGGAITISTQFGEDDRFVTFCVQDTGCGISAEDLERIFDPFFTTKEPGKGTGLGLSVSYGIVQRHGGTITVTSEVGKGSTFEVHLPVTEHAGNGENRFGHGQDRA
jgi:two-component system NtrC family sensor kinase